MEHEGASLRCNGSENMRIVQEKKRACQQSTRKWWGSRVGTPQVCIPGKFREERHRHAWILRDDSTPQVSNVREIQG